MTAFAPQTDLAGFRRALGAFATGVTVVTTMTPAGPVGITANSFASVSLDPPLILWSPAKASGRFATFRDAPGFAVHVLQAGQQALSDRFTRSRDAFAGLDWALSAQGHPALAGCLARFDCATHAQHDAGDHLVILGQVLDVVRLDGDPLVFHAGRFGGFQG